MEIHRGYNEIERNCQDMDRIHEKRGENMHAEYTGIWLTNEYTSQCLACSVLPFRDCSCCKGQSKKTVIQSEAKL